MMTSAYLRRLRGFSVVELMVSVVIGMLAVMFATRLLANSEQQKSSSVGSSDTMQNGMLAMFQMNNDAAQAGWGLNDELISGCDTAMQDTQGFQLTITKRNGADITPLAPVVIADGGLNSDVISMYSGSSPTGMGNEMVTKDYAGGSAITTASAPPYGFAAGDVIVMVPEPSGGRCSMAQLAVLPTRGAGGELSFAAGSGLRFNSGNLGGNTFLSGQARVYNLGQASRLSFHTWTVVNGRLLLRATDLAGTSQTPQIVVDNVVAIKAQYGFDTNIGDAFKPGSMQVNKWSTSMIDADGNGEVGNPGDYQHVAAIRLAVIARGGIPDKPDPKTGTCSGTTTMQKVFASNVPLNVPAVPVLVKLSVPGDPMDWTCYRYRSFETIVPIRNSGWRP
jgi:type IV pilus assembly protein PilW